MVRNGRVALNRPADLELGMLLEHLAAEGVAMYSYHVPTGEVWWSDGVYRLLGLDPGEVTPDVHRWIAQTVDEDRPMVEAAVQAGGDPEPREFRIRRTDGEIRWVRGSASPRGDILVGMLVDVTERREREAQTARAWRMYTAAQAVAALGTWTWSPATGRIEWSPEMFRIFGVPDEFVPTVAAFDVFVVPEDRPTLLASRQRAMETGVPEALELRIARPDGVRWITLRGETMVDETGQWFLGSVQDITERKELEAQAARLEKLGAVSRMASGVAAGFERILDVAAGQVDTLRATSVPGGEALHRAVADGRDLARRLRSLAPPSTDVGTVDLVDAARGASALVGSMSGLPSSIEVDVPAESVWVYGDRAEVAQVIISLLMNAREACPRGGTAHVTVRGGEVPTVEVRDDGVGMDADTLSRAFDPYFSTKGPGRGLGLAVVAGLVQKARGRIDLASTVGEGTRAIVRFNLAPAPSVESGPVLLLIDDPVAREVLRVVIAASGRPTRTTLDGPPPSRVLTDSADPIPAVRRRWDVPVVWCGAGAAPGGVHTTLRLPASPAQLFAALDGPSGSRR
jgi:PAS domain S-box-containing protein